MFVQMLIDVVALVESERNKNNHNITLFYSLPSHAHLFPGLAWVAFVVD